MSRYDGLIIPRSYNEYINKSDPLTLAQALQQNNVLSGAVAAGDNKAVKSGAVATALAGKQDTLTFDDTPTSGSNNPVKSQGILNAIKNAFDKAQNTITLSSWGFYLVCVSGAGYDPNYEGVFILYASDTQILRVHTIHNEGNNLMFTTSRMSITFRGVDVQRVYTTKIGEYWD